MSSSMESYPRTWCQLSCLHAAIFLALPTIFYSATVSSSKINLPYSKHCASFVPESIPSDPEFSTLPFQPEQDGYFLGGDGLFADSSNSTQQYFLPSNRRTLLFQTHHVYTTKVDDLYKIKASLILQPSGVYYSDGVWHSYSYSYSSSTSERGPLAFEMEGFWAKSDGKLCMMGSSSSTYSPEGKLRALSASLKLSGVRTLNNITSLARGTLESLSSADGSAYFEPVSLLMFPLTNYQYTEVSEKGDHGCTGGIDVPKSLSLGLPLSRPICSIFQSWGHGFRLEFKKGCNSTNSCNPFGDDIGYLPQVMSMSMIQCSQNKQNPRFLIEFPNSSYVDYYLPFTPNTTLVAEGSWDAKRNQLCIVACRISNTSDSFDNSRVEDCSIRLSLRFPAVWSVGNTSSIVGDIWSNKRASESGYFNRIIFRSVRDSMAEVPGLKYEYTLVEEAMKSCPKPKPSSFQGRQYPDSNSYDMRFDMSIKDSRGKGIGWGYSYPIFVGDQIPSSNSRSANNFPVQAKTNSSGQVNVSYEIRYTTNGPSSNGYTSFRISAEGLYDAGTGQLCMAGCKFLGSDSHMYSQDSVDCKVLVNLQFPPVNSNSYIKGRIQSSREKFDQLHFKDISFSAVSIYSRHARESIWRMDLEIIMSLTSNTLVCVFVGFQILYVKKHPSVSLSISLLMVAVLTVGQMIPLVLNFEALFLPKQSDQYFPYGSSGWVEVNEVIVRAVMMVAFLVQFRLLQLIWSAKLTEGNQKASTISEKKTFIVCLPLYIAGSLVALFVIWRHHKLGEGILSARNSSHQQSLWKGLGSYAGLVLDGFLFPQILLNIFQNSAEYALSHIFYLGITFVRLLPHGYDLYRAHKYDEDFNWSYMYANPAADFYSTIWDIVIPLGGLLFAAIIHLQQRFGGRCFLPKKFKQLEVYEKVPAEVEGDA